MHFSGFFSGALKNKNILSSPQGPAAPCQEACSDRSLPHPNIDAPPLREAFRCSINHLWYRFIWALSFHSSLALLLLLLLSPSPSPSLPLSFSFSPSLLPLLLLSLSPSPSLPLSFSCSLYIHFFHFWFPYFFILVSFRLIYPYFLIAPFLSLRHVFNHFVPPRLFRCFFFYLCVGTMCSLETCDCVGSPSFSLCAIRPSLTSHWNKCHSQNVQLAIPGRYGDDVAVYTKNKQKHTQSTCMWAH